jgi:hypothetical protein
MMEDGGGGGGGGIDQHARPQCGAKSPDLVTTGEMYADDTRTRNSQPFDSVTVIKLGNLHEYSKTLEPHQKPSHHPVLVSASSDFPLVCGHRLRLALVWWRRRWWWCQR